jgi:hypothetical protein
MLNCRVIFINGPVDADPSSVGKLLSEKLPDSIFLNGDEIVLKEGLDHAKWIIATVMTGTLRACELAHEGKLPIIAFPLREKDWKVITGLCDHAGVSPICITLEASEGLQQISFSSLTVKSSRETLQEACNQILSYLRQSEMR